MIETLGLSDYPLPQLLLAAGLALGLVFGALAQITRFCLRRSLIGSADDRRATGGVWLAALAGALLATQAAVHFGLVDLSDTRFLTETAALGGLVLGGLLFGVGMVLSRGCASRLTVLAASGNLRALIAMLLFAATAYATLRGVLAPVNVWAGGLLLIQAGGLDALTGVPALWLAVAASVALLALAAVRARPGALVLGLLIGLSVAGAWVATGYVLVDEFEPRVAEGLAFTGPAADSLFYAMAATALEPGFGLGLILGVLAGAHLSARLRGELRLESYESPEQTVRSLSGAALMGVGGVLAGGCSVGAGLAGVATLGLAPLVALASIIVGVLASNAALNFSVAPNPAMTPAE